MLLAEKIVTDNAVEKLEMVAQSGNWVQFQLPSGASVIVAPNDGFETLRLAMRDPFFIKSLKEAVQEVEEGKTQPFDEELFGLMQN